MMRPAWILSAILVAACGAAAQDPAPAPTPPPSPPAAAQEPTYVPPSSLPPIRIEVPTPPDKNSLDYDTWRYLFSADYLTFRAAGELTSQSVTQDIKNDLGVIGWKSDLNGRVGMRLGDRHKFFFEGTEYQLNGSKQVQETITLDGLTGSVNDQTESKVTLDYLNLEYERDLISKQRGFLGAMGTIAYLQERSDLIDVTRDIGKKSREWGAFPLFGAAGEIFPFRSRIFDINAESKGMNFWGYGFYLQSKANLEFAVTSHFSIQVGYSRLGMDLHTKGSAVAIGSDTSVSGMRAAFKGATGSLQWRIGR